jgi:integrase
MPKANLTDRLVASLKLGARYSEWRDEKTPGFGIRVSPNGVKTWFVVFRIGGSTGYRRRQRLGRYPAVGLEKARQRARKAISEVSEGVDPVKEMAAKEADLRRERVEASVFSQLAVQYLEWAQRNKREKTWKEYKRIIEKNLNPEFGKIDPKDLNPSHVRGYLRQVASRTPVLANRVRATMGAIFKWAITENLVAPERNPVSGISRPGGSETPKDRTLSDDELKAIWNALEKETSPVKDVLKLILLTGQRPGEVMGMRWDEIDWNEALWDLPGIRTKNGVAHVVPLSTQALRILDRHRGVLKARSEKCQKDCCVAPESPFIFPNRRLSKQGTEPVQMLRKMVGRVIERLGIKSFAPHDLRRTCATCLGKMEVPGFVIALILNHALPGVTNKVYNRYDYLKEKREALNAWGTRLSRIVSSLELAKVEDGETFVNDVELAGPSPVDK